METDHIGTATIEVEADLTNVRMARD